MPAFLFPGQATGRLLRPHVDLKIDVIRPDGVEATAVMKVLKERKAHPETFHIQANFTVNSLDLDEDNDDKQKS